YKTVDRPHGGANNFLRALRGCLEQDPLIEVIDDVRAPCDIIFMNQLSSGPGNSSAVIDSKVVLTRLTEPDRPKLVVRAVNLRRESHALTIRGFLPNWRLDRAVVKLLNVADRIVYQSDYQRGVFSRGGVRNNSFTRI